MQGESQKATAGAKLGKVHKAKSASIRSALREPVARRNISQEAALAAGLPIDIRRPCRSIDRGDRAKAAVAIWLQLETDFPVVSRLLPPDWHAARAVLKFRYLLRAAQGANCRSITAEAARQAELLVERLSPEEKTAAMAALGRVAREARRA